MKVDALHQECECGGPIMWKKWPDHVTTGRCAKCNKTWYAITEGENLELYLGSIKRPKNLNSILMARDKAAKLEKEIVDLAELLPETWDLVDDLQQEYRHMMYATWNLRHEKRKELKVQKEVIEERFNSLWDNDPDGKFEGVLLQHIGIMVLYEAIGGIA